MKRLIRRSEGESEELNISPLIDMTFLLLIFFMVSTSFTKEETIEIDRPNAESTQQAEDTSLRVFVDRAGDVFVDSSPVRPWMVQGRIRQLMRRTGRDIVLVVVDKGAPSGLLIDVVDQCRMAGAGQVSVAVEPKG